MSENKISVNQMTQFFKKELETIHPPREIEQFASLSFEHVLNFSKIDMILRQDSAVNGEEQKALKEIVERLKKEEPIQYILGNAHFYGLNFKVSPDVLIPRPETEELVRWVLDDGLESDAQVMDVCTGSGCIAISLKDAQKGASVYGVDKSVKALNMASDNASANNVGVEFFHFDVLEQESFGFMQFDVMVSNPPYVRELEKELMTKNVLAFEPHLALFVDDHDPLLFYRKIVELAEGHLKKGGRLYFEINEAYGPEILQLLRDMSYSNCELRTDLNGRNRMVRGVKS